MTDLKNPKLQTINCYLENSSKAIIEADTLFVQEEGGDLVVKNIEDYLALVRLGYKTFVNTLEDCSGKTVKIELGDSLLANSLEGLLNGILNGKGKI